MKRLVLAVLAVVALAATAAEEKMSAKKLAEKNRALVAKYGASLVTVRYYLKRNANGEAPEIEVPYKCPNCGETHFRSVNNDPEKKIPAEVAGFVVAPDRVIVQDMFIPTDFIGRVAVVTPAGETDAVEFERAPGKDALALKTAKPLADAAPLAFTAAGEPENPQYFYAVTEDGLLTSGVGPGGMENFRHLVDLDVDVYEGKPNTLVLDAEGNAVTVAMERRIRLGAETFEPPSAWKWESADAWHGRLAALKAKLAKSVFPVFVQLEAEAREDSDRDYWSGSRNDNDIDTTGVLLPNGKVLVVCGMKPSMTARLQRMEAHLPGGAKAELAFEGSLKTYDGFIATFKGAAPEGLVPVVFDDRKPLELFGERVFKFECVNRGEVFEFKDRLYECGHFKRIRNNELQVSFERIAGFDFDGDRRGSDFVVVASDGRLVAIDLSERKEDHERGDVQGRRLAELAAAPAYDPENVPRTGEDRKRVAWFGVDVQNAGADIVREKKAASFLGRYVDRAPLVMSVVPGSPAEKAGVRAGDILAKVRYASGEDEDTLRAPYDYDSEFKWAEVFDESEFYDAGMLMGHVPWQSVAGGFNLNFAKYGIGSEIEVDWVRDGVKMSGRCTLVLAPVHFENAPRKRNKDLGITVCDMTAEVRKYFKFDEKAPGVVVVKVKGGGVAAVAGLKPLEIITEVNGEPVADAKAFADKVRDRKELNFNVRRLTQTRMVPIRL